MVKVKKTKKLKLYRRAIESTPYVMTKNNAFSPPFTHRCGHSCCLRSSDECCQCSDSRPHQDHGYYLSSLSQIRVPRSAAYCITCQSSFLKRRSSPTKNDYHLHQLILHQQRIIHAQQQDIRTALLIAQRLPFLENMMKAKDAEIQHLEIALTRRH